MSTFMESEPVITRLIRRILDLPEDRQSELLEELEMDHSFDDQRAGKRDNNRKHYSKPISFFMGSTAFEGVSQDISETGMFIKTDSSFHTGQVIILSIPFTDNSRNLKIPAEIVRITPSGIGVRFLPRVT